MFRDAEDGSSHQLGELSMGTEDRASDTEDAEGRIQEPLSSITRNRDLKNEDTTEQAKAEMKKNLKDAGYGV
jgi:hypothetical protein